MTLGRTVKDELADIMSSINDHVELADYIIKSPPKEKQHNALVRWCMRWFVLYYNRAQNKCWLLYFQNEEAFLSGKLPKGKIDLKLSKIKEHKTPMNKYEYVIDVIAVKRTFHLCFLNRKIYQKWLTTLKECHSEVWSSQVQQKATNNNNNNTYNQQQQKQLPIVNDNDIEEDNNLDNADPDPDNDNDDHYLHRLDYEEDLSSSITNSLGNHNEDLEEEDEEDQRYLDNGEVDLMESLRINDNGDSLRNIREENDDVFDKTASISSNRSSISYQSYTPPPSRYRNSIDVGAMRSQHQHSPFLLNNRKMPSRSTTIPKDINELLLEADTKHEKRYASLQEVSTTKRTSISPLNIHLEMLERLEKAAAKRPLSDGSDYDMGGFTGPRFNYSHQ